MQTVDRDGLCVLACPECDGERLSFERIDLSIGECSGTESKNVSITCTCAECDSQVGLLLMCLPGVVTMSHTVAASPRHLEN